MHSCKSGERICLSQALRLHDFVSPPLAASLCVLVSPALVLTVEEMARSHYSSPRTDSPAQPLSLEILLSSPGLPDESPLCRENGERQLPQTPNLLISSCFWLVLLLNLRAVATWQYRIWEYFLQFWMLRCETSAARDNQQCLDGSQ